MGYSDSDLLNWLESQYGCALLNDDNGHWTVSFDGMQNIPEGDEPSAIATSFFIEAKDWKNSVREAIETAMGQNNEEV